MPKYVNPLDDFQSHSTHFVVLACRSTEDLRAFTSQERQDVESTLRAIDSAKTLGAEVAVPGAATRGSVFLMIDTRRFSQFTVDNFQLETYLSGLAAPGGGSPHGTSVNMGFNVVDSVGISFANFLQWLMDQKLQVGFDGMILLVRVLFVGHRPDGTSQTVQTVTIPAIFNEIQVDLSDTKGVYTCKLFPLSGMTSTRGFNKRWTQIGTASSFFTGAGTNRLVDVVNAFERRLNEESLGRYRKMSAKAQRPGAGTKDQADFGRPVQFMLTIPKSWHDFQLTGPANGSAKETDFREALKREEEARAKARTSTPAQGSGAASAQSNAATPGQDSHVSVDAGMTVTEVLDFIFKQCADIAKLGNFTPGQPDKDITLYKHIITVTSSDASYTVHVDVVEFIVPNVYLNEKSAQADRQAAAAERDRQLFEVVPAANGVARKKVPRNFIELDYMFTGKNLDVLSLDLKIENLTFLLAAKTKIGSSELFVASDTGQEQEDGEGVARDERQLSMRPKDPVLMPLQTDRERANQSHVAGNLQPGPADARAVSQQYMRNLSAFYNAGPVTAKLELRGNPQLMSGTVPGEIPRHVTAVTIASTPSGISETNLEVKAQYRAEFERSLLAKNAGLSAAKGGAFAVRPLLSGPSYVTSPVFVKVNVRTPNVDFQTNELVGGDFTRPLFEDNYYYLSKITHKIDGGKFVQEMELYSYSVYGYQTTTAQGLQSSFKPKETA